MFGERFRMLMCSPSSTQTFPTSICSPCTGHHRMTAQEVNAVLFCMEVTYFSVAQLMSLEYNIIYSK